VFWKQSIRPHVPRLKPLIGVADVRRYDFEDYTVVNFLVRWIAENQKIDRPNFDFAGPKVGHATIRRHQGYP
jgi:hypothetical protein